MTVTQHSQEIVPTSNNHTRKRALIVITMAFGLFGGLYLLYWCFYARFYESTDDAYVRGNNVPVMSQIPGHVNAIFADETDAVIKGQKIIQLDTLDAAKPRDRQ